MNTFRWIPELTEDHIQQAVLMGRAVVALDERLARAQHDVAERDAKIEELNRYLREAGQRHDATRKLLSAVTELHREADQVACGDGCCHEGLGVCDYCEEPWPCKTYRVAEGRDDAQPPGGDGA